jgi:hypothetical protein
MATASLEAGVPLSRRELLEIERKARGLGALHATALHDSRRGRVDLTLQLDSEDPGRAHADLGRMIAELATARAWKVAGISYYAAPAAAA